MSPILFNLQIYTTFSRSIPFKNLEYDQSDVVSEDDDDSSMPELITQEEFDLRNQTGIFDWPISVNDRLNEDECYIGFKYEGKEISDPY